MTTETREAGWQPVPQNPGSAPGPQNPGATPGPQNPGATPDPYYLPDGRVGGHTGTDFPAPDGVATVIEHRPAATKKPRRKAGVLVAAASLSAVLGAGAGLGYAHLASGPLGSPVSVSTLPAAQSPKLDGTVTAAAAKIDPSLVTITVQNGANSGLGSGVVIDKQGHILTNAHVVNGASDAGTISVTFGDGRSVSATVVGISETNDLAVIKVDAGENLTPAVFAKSDSLQVGQTVVAAGAPLGLSESVTSGIVSNTERPVRSGSNNDAVYLAVQTDAAINPGNSGGPLVDLNGAVVGINSSIASTGSSSTAQSGNIGIGFAIPSDVAIRVATDLIEHGSSKNAALGVSVGGTDSEVSSGTGVPLESVVSGGAADKAGLHAGDVVTKINDFHTTTADGLIAATRFYAPDTVVKLTYTRDGGSPQTVDVTLGSA